MTDTPNTDAVEAKVAEHELREVRRDATVGGAITPHRVRVRLMNIEANGPPTTVGGRADRVL